MVKALRSLCGLAQDIKEMAVNINDISQANCNLPTLCADRGMRDLRLSRR